MEWWRRFPDVKEDVLDVDLDHHYTKLAFDTVFDKVEDGKIPIAAAHVSSRETDLIMDSDFELVSDDEDAE
jgi:hypothetical protein